MGLSTQVKISPITSSLAISFLADAKKIRESQCDTAYDIERVTEGWRVVPKKCVECDGYDIQCKDYSYERNKK